MAFHAYRTIAAFVVAATTCLGVGDGLGANMLEKNFWLSGPRYDAVVPLCDHSWALFKIRARFGRKESRFWSSDLRIEGIEDIRETAFMPWRHGTIPRRFCRATAVISDGAKRPLYYSIAEDAGFIGASWGVEWCVVGLDRNFAYNPNCRMARP